MVCWLEGKPAGKACVRGSLVALAGFDAEGAQRAGALAVLTFPLSYQRCCSLCWVRTVSVGASLVTLALRHSRTAVRGLPCPHPLQWPHAAQQLLEEATLALSSRTMQVSQHREVSMCMCVRSLSSSDLCV